MMLSLTVRGSWIRVLQMYHVTLLHVSHHGQFDVIRKNTRVSPLL